MENTTRVEVGQSVNLTGKSSSPAQGHYLTDFAWDFGDGTRAKGITVTHAYDSAGEYEVKLMVTDNKGLSDTIIHKIVVQKADQLPQPVIQAPSQAKVGEVVLFNGSLSRCTNLCDSYVWDVGDGNVYYDVSIKHVYLSPATYNVTLIVTDDKGGQSSIGKQISVN